MADHNPYAAPKSRVSDDSPGAAAIATLNRAASGQRIIIFSLLGGLAAWPLRAASGELATILSLVASVCAIVGVVRLTGGLGTSVPMRVLYCIAMLIPLINILVMVLLS